MQADLVRLQHMRDAAIDAVYFVQGRQRTDMWTDRQLAYAVVKAIAELQIVIEGQHPDGGR